MDDKRIEDLLRKAWDVEPPDGMRERVLRKSREAASPAVSRWRFALATAGILAVIVLNLMNFGVQTRITAMTGIRDVSVSSTAFAGLLESRLGIQQAFAADFNQEGTYCE